MAGIVAGIVDVAVNDLLFTALIVLASCIVLGMLRPKHPWRWIAIVGVFIPLTEFAATLNASIRPSRGQIYESFLAFLPGIAGAYGGSFLRGVMENLKRGL